MFSPFDSMFDFNGDGKMNSLEKGAEMDYIDRVCETGIYRKRNRESASSSVNDLGKSGESSEH